jgi:predicted nucleotidyltransferase
VILFGSAGRGENDADSDIDLFVLAGDPAVAREVLRPFVPKYRLQTVVVTPTDESGLKEKDKVFYEEVRRGIVLWEKSE